MKRTEKLCLIIAIVFIALLAVFFGMKKVNYHCDEIWTYGLSNHIGGIKPDIEIGKTYTGLGPFESFVEVMNGEKFSYANVWENQAKDVHPPLYYLLIHTICSVFSGSFSKWYGIGLNIFWMISILVLLYKITKRALDNTLLSLGMVLIYGSTTIFMDTIIFIRMYAQFTFFAVLLAYLFQTYWDKALDRGFYIKVGLIAFFGMLSHYYFLIYVFVMCVIFGIKLIIKKDYVSVKKYVISLGISGLIYGVVWYHIIAHVFNGYRGEETLDKIATFGGYFVGGFELLKIINSEAFFGTMPLFVLIAFVLLFISLKNKNIKLQYEFYLLIGAVLYVFIIGKIAPHLITRYVMAVGWIFVLYALIILKKLCNIITNMVIVDYVIIIAFLILNILNFASRGWTIPMDYRDKGFYDTVNAITNKEAIVYINDNWKILYDFEILQNAKSYAFGDESTIDRQVKSMEDDFVLIVNVDEGREELVSSLDTELLFVNANNHCYLVHTNK